MALRETIRFVVDENHVLQLKFEVGRPVQGKWGQDVMYTVVENGAVPVPELS